METSITVLLAEYETLRAEVLAARGNVGQGAAVFSAAIMADLAFGFSAASKFLEVPIILGFLAAFYFWAILLWNEKNTESFTRRLREIENEINTKVGERLLIWETLHGWGGMYRQTNPNFRGYTSPETPQSN